MNKINILYFSSSRGIGITYHLTEYIQVLKRKGVNIIAVYGGPIEGKQFDLIKSLNENNIINLHIPQLESINPVHIIKNIIFIARLIDENDVNIIQCQGNINLIITFFATKVSNKKTRKFTYFHSFPLNYFKNINNQNIILHILMVFYNYFLDCVFPVSNQTRKSLLDAGLNHEKAVVIHNGLDFVKINKFKSKNLNKDEKKILDRIGNKKYVIYAAQLEEHKGHKILLNSFKLLSNHLKDVKLVIVGDGSLRDELISFSVDCGLEEVVNFTGKLEYETTIKLMSKSYFAVVSSFSETFCHAMIEPMALGKPVITTNVGVAEETIYDGYNGFIVPVGDSYEMSKKINYLIENPIITEKMGANAKKTVEKKFSNEVISEKLLKIYNELLKT
ncbi:glycosyltransferase family 4 protein [Methanobacterium sp.]|uniref:glycosyltransferase family 4 protein n=1 Tax=Methanobacterium sp. TaxID=2164 RepID=UPI0025CFB12E|nr:glycosyltransferase family 4 protein [Methanobacterium sp.]MBI5459242.1 glycosyltransferase family 4 protein [Methanobacterium sp.]